MSRKRLVFYLLLNALVSVLVTGSILYFYNRANPKTDCGTSVIIPTLAPGDIKTDIVSVTAAGVIANESVSIQNNGGSELPLEGWLIKDGQGSSYTFPPITLYPGGSVQVHSGAGIDTAADLYWGLPAPVWKSGELVALYDTQNIARAFYRIP